jgi:hypothetical protein
MREGVMRVEIAVKPLGPFPVTAINTPTTREGVASILLRLTRTKVMFGDICRSIPSQVSQTAGTCRSFAEQYLGSREPLLRQRNLACIEQTF